MAHEGKRIFGVALIHLFENKGLEEVIHVTFFQVFTMLRDKSLVLFVNPQLRVGIDVFLGICLLLNLSHNQERFVHSLNSLLGLNVEAIIEEHSHTKILCLSLAHHVDVNTAHLFD